MCEIKNEDFGIVETNVDGKKFYCFFHRSNVWLRDGKRGVEVDFFRDKPLSAMVTNGQKVNLSARYSHYCKKKILQFFIEKY